MKTWNYEAKPMSTADDISAVCDGIKNMLLEKNRAYGDSALNPMRVFSRADAIEQIKVRIDDKLSRLSRGSALPDESLEDTVNDLMGYLVLLKIAKMRDKPSIDVSGPSSDKATPDSDGPPLKLNIRRNR